MPATRAVNAGELLTLADLNPDECFPEPPTVNGTPAAFFLCLSSLLNFITMFDFTPNAPPDPNGAAFETRPMRYPLTEIARAEQMLLAMRPIEKYKQLADASWPPGPGHYPSVLWQMHRDPRIMEQADFAEIVAASYSAAYWKRQMAFWTETNFFGDRLSYVKKAIDEYLVGDYLSSIYVVVPHFRGHREGLSDQARRNATLHLRVLREGSQGPRAFAEGPHVSAPALSIRSSRTSRPARS